MSEVEGRMKNQRFNPVASLVPSKFTPSRALMSTSKGSRPSLTVPHSTEDHWQQAQEILTVLSTLNYQTGALDDYLQHIAQGVSSLLNLDWSVITLCRAGQERVMASNLPLVTKDDTFALHGSLTEKVVQTGQILAVEDTAQHPELGDPPPGYCSYLGIPLVTSTGEVIGTICSFSAQTRRYSPGETKTVGLFAERAVAAIENFQLFQQLQHLNEHLEAEVAQRTEQLRQAQVRLIEKERLAAIGEFAAMIVHEIRNPITTITMALSALKPQLSGEVNAQRIALAQDETERLQKLAKEILLYSKPQELSTTPLEIHDFIESLLDRLRGLPAGANRQLTFIPATTKISILGDRDKLTQVMINLVSNAFEAIAPQQTVTCRIYPAPPDQVWIQVQNGGDPISPTLLQNLNQPFHSTKVEGTGLGLTVVQRIVAAHGGSFLLESALDTGTIATVRLPIA